MNGLAGAINGRNGIERSWVSDECKHLRDGVHELLVAVADVEVPGDVALELGVAAALRRKEAKGHKFAFRDGKPAHRIVVAEAVLDQPAADPSGLGRALLFEVGHRVVENQDLERAARVTEMTVDPQQWAKRPRRLRP